MGTATTGPVGRDGWDDLGTATAAIAAVAATAKASSATAKASSATAKASSATDDAAAPGDLLNALVLLHQVQAELATMEPVLIAAARAAGVSWQLLAPALGVASRQAAERRYLRLASAATEQRDDTRDGRVRAERDRRAGHRAVARWANDNTADLRRLAGQIAALTDLDDVAGEDVDRLQDALADPDAAALPHLLARSHRHLTTRHPDLADQIDTVTSHADDVRRRTQQRRDGAPT